VYDGFGLDEKRNFCYIFVINEETVLFWRFWWNFFLFILRIFFTSFGVWLPGSLAALRSCFGHSGRVDSFLMVVGWEGIGWAELVVFK
jgi:hypothetical protein